MLFGARLRKLLTFDSDDIDIVCRITEHFDRPQPLRPYDQIAMHSGSMIRQAKLIEDYIKNRTVVFLGDNDCMSLVVGLLSKEGIISAPEHILVLDFDKRILRFIEGQATELGLSSMIQVHTPWYNVKYPIPDEYVGQFDAFYTNPPYGQYNDGQSINIFLGRCMELNRGGKSWGCAILPFQHNEGWTRKVMGNVQTFLTRHGYIITEMLRELHAYALDDAPHLLSSTVILDRFDDRTLPYNGRNLTDDELINFYGRASDKVPDYIDLEGNPVYSNDNQ